MTTAPAHTDSIDIINQQVEETVSVLSEMTADTEIAEESINSLASPGELKESISNGEAGAACLFAQIHQGRFVYDHLTDRWFEWQGNFWREDLKKRAIAALDTIVDLYQGRLEDIKRKLLLAKRADDDSKVKTLQSSLNIVCKRIRALQSRTCRMNVLKLASVDWTYRDRPSLAINGDEWDSNPDLLGCQNGVVDLRTGQFIEGNPEDYIKSVAQTEWLSLETPARQWQNFLHQIFDGDEDLTDYVQRLLGYSITGHTTEHIFPIFWGAGRNGKSTFTEAVGNVLGPDIAAPVASEILLSQGRLSRSGGPTSDILALRSKRLVWGSETDEGRRLNIGKLKWLTGGDTLTGRPPYGKHQISFRPTHKLFLNTNHRPHAPANDYALWARIHLIPFSQSFVESPTRENEHQVDPELPARLKEEASGILAWLVRGNLMWRDEGLNPPEIVRAATESYRSEEDYIGQFIRERCETGLGLSETAGRLYRAYQTWSGINGLKPLSIVKFARRLSTDFNRDDSGRNVAYHGLRLINSG
jgi:putative DNA primase/helicase